MSKWRKYTGYYRKTWYDIKLVTGEIIYHCWPNANTFHAPDGRVYNADLVAETLEASNGR